MDFNLTGIDDLRASVDRLVMCAKTLMMAADKIDEALAAHIEGMATTVSRLEAVEARMTQRTGGYNGLSNSEPNEDTTRG